MTTSNSAPLTTRWINDSDVGSCIKLINDVFAIERSEAEYRWKFFDSPPRSARVLIAEDAQSKALRGHYAVVPLYLNMSGESLLCCQSGDTAVHKEAEGKGLFAKCAAEAFETLEQQDYSCVYGFPNANSYPGFARRLGWARVGRLRRYRMLMRLKSIPLQLWRLPFLTLKLKRIQANNSVLNACKFTYGTGLPEGTDKLWAQIAAFEKFSLKKDQQYLDWRYSRNPFSKYQFFAVNSADSLLGLLIGRIEGDRFFITELLSAKKDMAIGAFLVSSMLKHMIMNSSVKAIEFVGRDDGFFDEAFADFQVHSSSLIFCLRSFGNKVKPHQIENVVNWTVTLGDLDNL
jgi:hypothetical protein